MEPYDKVKFRTGFIGRKRGVGKKGSPERFGMAVGLLPVARLG